MSRGRGSWVALAAVAAGAATVGLTIPASAGTTASVASVTAAVPQLHWRPCGGGFQCARVGVPLDYDTPRGARISLALIRLPATDQRHRVGSMFVNPGGPGGSGVQFVRAAGKFLWTATVRARLDIVGFDPRGVGASTPIHCYPSAAAENRALGSVPPFPFPASTAQVSRYFAAWQRFDAACLAREGRVLQHVSTADVARDLDLLRQAVGDRGLTYDGVSYGTFLGQVYANLFPSKVRALVIDGVLDPIAWTTGRGDAGLPFSTRLHSADGAQATLEQFFATCDAAGRSCAFSPGNPARKYAQLVVKAKAGRLTFHGQQVTWPQLDAVTLGAMYSPRSWPQFAGILQRVWRADPAAAAALDRLRATLNLQANYPNGTDAFAAIACSDSNNPHNVFAWPRAAAFADRTAPYFGDIWTYASAPCATWPTRAPDRYTGPWTARTAQPVLVIGNRYDPATRYRGAQIAARLLPRSRLLTLNGYGHTALGQSRCIDRARDAYLVTGALPPAGTICQPDFGPFHTATPSSQAAMSPIPLPPTIG